MPLPLLVPFIAGGLAAGSKLVGSALTKDSADYVKEVPRHDLAAGDNLGVDEDGTGGRYGSYARYNSYTGQKEWLVDRGNFNDQFAAMNDPNSDRSLSYELGNQRGFAQQLSNSLAQRAEDVRNLQAEQANLAYDAGLAADQRGLLNAYMSQFSGQGPSVADLQARSAMGSNARNMLASQAAGSPSAQRAAMLGGMSNAMSIGSNFANQRSEESWNAANSIRGLSGAMSSVAVDNGVRQAKLDLQNRYDMDALAMNYYGQQKSVDDAQFEAQGNKGADMVAADRARKFEVLGSAKLASERDNKKINTVLGAIDSGTKSAGMLGGK